MGVEEWTWNDKMGSRGRKPACLVITPQGDVHRFSGQNIEGVVRVIRSDYTKQGKWSNTTFHCVSPLGTRVYTWSQSWGEGLYWPQGSWEEAIATVQQVAPQVRSDAIEAVIRLEWPKAAERFDDNRQAFQAFTLGEEESIEWSWDDQLGNRSRQPACLIITFGGEVYRFKGEGIEGVVQITSRDYIKQGRWSHTTFHCMSPAGTRIYSWRQDWDLGFFWSQDSWEEAIATVQQVAPQVRSDAIEAVIRLEWPKAAEKFDFASSK